MKTVEDANYFVGSMAFHTSGRSAYPLKERSELWFWGCSCMPSQQHHVATSPALFCSGKDKINQVRFPFNYADSYTYLICLSSFLDSSCRLIENFLAQLGLSRALLPFRCWSTGWP